VDSTVPRAIPTPQRQLHPDAFPYLEEIWPRSSTVSVSGTHGLGSGERPLTRIQCLSRGRFACSGGDRVQTQLSKGFVPFPHLTKAVVPLNSADVAWDGKEGVLGAILSLFEQVTCGVTRHPSRAESRSPLWYLMRTRCPEFVGWVPVCSPDLSRMFAPLPLFCFRCCCSCFHGVSTAQAG
jgi:hypothetical protein